MALFRDSGALEQAGYVEGHRKAERSACWNAMVGSVRDFVGDRSLVRLVVELPQVYVQARQKGDPNDLIQLAAVVGGLCEAFRRVPQRVYLPAEWKGQVPKEIIHARVKARLSNEELGRIICRKKALMHNVLDAVGIGTEFLGRLRPVRTPWTPSPGTTASGA